MRWTATITARDYDDLHGTLFRADRDEHAAFLYAGMHRGDHGGRLLVRRVVPVADEEFGPSDRGAFRAISPKAIARAARKCDEEGLCLLWAHSHPTSADRVGFSGDDLDSHRRIHPHLIDMAHGRPVAGLVFGEESVAGEIWTAEDAPARLESMRILGRQIRDLRPQPLPANSGVPERFARQALLFGETGQAILSRLTVAVIGAGGGGSLIVQSLAHLGVGRILIIDFDHINTSNLSRVVGATEHDAKDLRLKVDVLNAMVERIDPAIEVEAIAGDITYRGVARRVADADFAFLATDTTYARYAFNALAHQYLIPGIQVGGKVSTNSETGAIDLVHTMERPVTLDGACLDCSGAIEAEQLRRDQLSDDERAAQDYVGAEGEDQVEDPSVITLNSISTSLATTDFLFAFTGLLLPGADLGHRVYYPEERRLRAREPKRRPGCRWCDPDSRYTQFAAGDVVDLPLRRGHRPRSASAHARIHGRGRELLSRFGWGSRPKRRRAQSARTAASERS